MSFSQLQLIQMQARLDAARLKKLNTAPEGSYVAKNNIDGIRPNHSKSSKRSALVSQSSGEDSRWYGTARRFEVTYTIFSQHPCDYDGYDIKSLQDFLVKSEVIPDDKWDLLSGRVISCKAHTEEEERTEIEITELTPL